MDFSNLEEDIKRAEPQAPAPTSARPDEPFPEHAAQESAAASDPLYNTVDEADKEYTTLDGQTKVKQDTEHNACPSCGAPMEFDPDSGELKCPYCSTKKGIAVVEASEIYLQFGLDQSKKWSSETRVFHCDNCGAETVFDKSEFAKKCIFCGSPNVVTRDDIEGIRPNAVVPFAFDKAKAGEHYRKWIKSRFYAPRAFKKLTADKFSGVYSPAWTFDSVTRSSYSGTVGDYYYVTVGSGKNRRTERRIRWRSVSGNYAYDFNDVLVSSGVKIDAATVSKLSPFPTEGSVAYDPGYLAGYSAEHYSTGLDQGWVQAQSRMKDAIYHGIVRSLHCDVVGTINVNTQFLNNTFKYELLPVYVTHQKYKKKEYTFFVNGATGKTTGRHPVSAGKVLLTVLGALLLVGGIIALILLNT